jgi:hypothetical protein
MSVEAERKEYRYIPSFEVPMAALTAFSALNRKE